MMTLTKENIISRFNLTDEQFYGLDIIESDLDLRNEFQIPIGFNPNVKKNLYLNSLIEIPIGFNPKVGLSLHLSSITQIPFGFNPIVGHSLYLNSLKCVPDDFNPIVERDLYLNSINECPKHLTNVKRNLYFSNKSIQVNFSNNYLTYERI